MNAIILILLGFAFLVGVLAGMLTLLVAGIRSDDRRRNIHLAPRTRGQSASRRLLVNVRKSDPESGESEED